MADNARVRRHDVEDAVHEGGPEVAPFARVAGGVVRAEGPWFIVRSCAAQDVLLLF